MSKERMPRCARCNRRWSKDPKSVRLRWIDLDSKHSICPDCQTGWEQLQDVMVKSLIDHDKVAALEASGELPERREDFDMRTVLRNDVTEEQIQAAGLVLMDFGDCDCCGEAPATRRNPELGSFCEHCARVLVEDAMLEMEEEGKIEIDGDMIRFKKNKPKRGGSAK